MTDISSPPVRWTGSKFSLAQWIISHFPEHVSYIEPFCGGASVLFRKSRSRIEVINDLNQEVTNFFDVLRDRSDELQRALRLTPYSRLELRRAHEPHTDSLERARRFYIRSWQKFNAGTEGHPGSWRFITQEMAADPVGDWKKRAEEIPLFAERLRDVYIECDTAISVIKRFDKPTALFFCDPPYVLDTRTHKSIYASEMSDEDHEVLAKALNSIDGMALISGYDCDLYRDLYKGWQMVTKQAFDTRRIARTECLWISPSVMKAQRRQPLF